MDMAGGAFSFRSIDRARFYIMYFVRKVFFVWFEVRRPRLRMFLYELLYSAAKLLRRDLLVPSPFGADLVETKFGSFRVRPGTLDMSNVSPAFEREDVDRLLGLVGRLEGEGRKTLFLDVGADIGTYTVAVGRRFRGYGGLGIMCFEPVSSSYGILLENIRINGLSDKARAYNIALWGEEREGLVIAYNPRTPGSSGAGLKGEAALRVRARPLDAIVQGQAGGFDALVMKMDVEGAEEEVLKGAVNTLSSFREAHILVEDFINTGVVGRLEEMGAEFVAKLTPYNSWWLFRGGRERPERP